LKNYRNHHGEMPDADPTSSPNLFCASSSTVEPAEPPRTAWALPSPPAPRSNPAHGPDAVLAAPWLVDEGVAKRSTSKPAIIALAVALLAALGGATVVAYSWSQVPDGSGPTVAWETTTADEGQLTFSMPGNATHQSVEPPWGSTKVDTYATNTPDAEFVVSSFPAIPLSETGYPDPASMLDAELHGIAGGLGAVPDPPKDSNVNGRTAREVELHEGDRSGRCISILSPVLVVDACVLGTPNLNDADYRRLVDGIRITE
jgi:hypothetical protein